MRERRSDDRRTRFRVDGRTCIVTGASSGIGAECARELAAAGGRIVAVGRNRYELEAQTREISDTGGKVHMVLADLCEDGAAQIIVEEALRTFGSIDVLTHSAAVFEPMPFLDTSMESYDRQFAINVRAAFVLTQAAVRHIGRGGSIIFFSSIAGHVGFQGATAYCMTKGAIELLVKGLSLELAPKGIRVNAVAPGNIHTRMNAHLFAEPGYEELMLASTPAGRVGEVEDIAPYVVFLASEESEYIHGTSLLIDGGWAVP